VPQELPIVRFIKLKFLNINLLIRYILPLIYLEDQASHISPLLFISLFGQGPVRVLVVTKKVEFFYSIKKRLHSQISATFLVVNKAYLHQTNVNENTSFFKGSRSHNFQVAILLPYHWATYTNKYPYVFNFLRQKLVYFEKLE